MKIFLTIKEDYCSSWDLFDGIREFIQNGRDAAKEGFPLQVQYNEKLNKLKLITQGTTLARETLLLGSTSKEGKDHMLGQHGEGYKIGSLVLLRLGKTVRIRTANETWRPEISFSKAFGANAIAFSISKNTNNINQIGVEIGFITPQEWEMLREKFLFLTEPAEEPVGVCPVNRGSVLRDRKGQIFVDGIYVFDHPTLTYGYDFSPSVMRLDRDRRVISSFEIQNLACKIWASLFVQYHDSTKDMVHQMLEAYAEDVRLFDNQYVVDDVAMSMVADDFRARYGPDAMAVASESEARELQFFGRIGKVVSSVTLRSILQTKIGTIEDIKKSLGAQVQTEYQAIRLSRDEAHNLLISQEFVRSAIGRSLPPIKVVDFADPKILGMRRGGEIFIAKKILGDLKETICTVVEEVAHEYGPDGSHDHVERIHDIYGKGVIGLMNRPAKTTEDVDGYEI